MATKPGEKALEAIKELNKSVVLFKTPEIPKPKKEKIQILTEERYVEELGKIIQRDFFPDLEKLQAQNQYLDAIEKNDISKLRELYAKYSGRKPASVSGRESPLTFDTPVNLSEPNTPERSTRSNKTTSSRSSKGESKSLIDNHSLDSFLQSHTSEDNHSFHEIIEAADRKLQQKFSVLLAEEEKQAIKMANCLQLPSIEKQFEMIEGPKTVNTWTYKNKNYVMFVPDGVKLTKEEEIEMAKRKQQIVHNNTRLQSNPFDDKQSKDTIFELAKTQSKTLDGKVGVDGNTLNSKTPQIRGFSFVKSPSPCPGITDSPVMTWGEIEGSPFRLDGSDTPVRPSTGPAFRIAEQTRREVIAMELAEKAGERLRGQKAKAIETAKRNIASPYVRSSIDRLASMSPAARRLASMKFGIKDAGGLGAITPSPTNRRDGSIFKTPKSMSSPLVKTPNHKRSTPNRLNTPQSGSSITTSPETITDDLLKIPGTATRSKASDFF